MVHPADTDSESNEEVEGQEATPAGWKKCSICGNEYEGCQRYEGNNTENCRTCGHNFGDHNNW